jgi:hypothetical protein
MAIILTQTMFYGTSGDLVSSGGNQSPVSATLAGTLQSSLTLNVGTASHVLLPPSELATPGLCVIKYMGAANYVQIGTDSTNDGLGVFQPFSRIYANAPIPLSMPLDGSLKLYAKCNTAAADIFIQVYQR